MPGAPPQVGGVAPGLAAPLPLQQIADLLGLPSGRRRMMPGDRDVAPAEQPGDVAKLAEKGMDGARRVLHPDAPLLEAVRQLLAPFRPARYRVAGRELEKQEAAGPLRAPVGRIHTL